MQQSGNIDPSSEGREGLGQIRDIEGDRFIRGLKVVPKVWSVSIPIDMPSLNVYMRWHYRKQTAWRNTIEQYIFVLGQPIIQFDGPVFVDIVRHYGHRKREYDTDNLYASVKPILDSLKTPKGRSRSGLSVIVDDNPKICRLSVSQQKSSDKFSKIVVSVVDRKLSDTKMLSDWSGSN